MHKITDITEKELGERKICSTIFLDIRQALIKFGIMD